MIRRSSSLPVHLLGACGVAAAVVFIVADAVGSVLTPRYSMWSDAISELVERGAPFKYVVDPLLVMYHSLVLLFAFGIQRAIYANEPRRTGPVLLMAAGISGVLLTLYFPCDPGCEPFVSLRGALHILIAVPMGISILIAIWITGRTMRRSDVWTGYASYSSASSLVGVALAGVTVVFAETQFVGVLERALTLTYLQWFLVIGARIARI